MILQNQIGDTASEKSAMDLAKKNNIPLILRASNASTLLKKGDKVALDAKMGLVYRADDGRKD